MDLTTYIKHPERLDAAAVEELSRLCEAHPCFQAARLLLVRGLYQLQDDAFGQALRRAALFVPDRTQLFELIEGPNFRPAPEEKKRQLPAPPPQTADRTVSLIDSFLSQLPEEPQPRRAHAADATVDYMSYLMQLEDAAEADEEPEKMRQDTEDWEDEEDDAETTEPDAPDEDDLLPLGLEENDPTGPSEAFFTETLARIYIKQGKYLKAIEIIRRLSLNFPKKNRYFADQIRFLEKLLINEQGKQDEETGDND